MFNLSWEKAAERFVEISKEKFLAVALLSFFSTFGFILISTGENIWNYTELSEKIILAMFLFIPTFFISSAISRFMRKKENIFFVKQLSQLIPIFLFTISFHFINFFDYFNTNIFLTVFFLYLFSSLLFYFFLTKKKMDIEEKNETIFNNIISFIYNIISASFVFIFTLLLVQLILFSLEKLFSIELSIYIRIGSIFIILFFSGILFLSKIMVDKNLKKNFLIDFLTKKILFPFFIFYFFILYLYLGKVLLNFNNWPEGIVAYLILFFSTSGIILFIFSERLKKESKIAEKIFKFFPILILPLVFLLFYTMQLRISEYGWTLSRYLVIIFGFYLLIFSIYFTFFKIKNISFIFYSFITVVLLFSFIPKISFWEFPKNEEIKNLQKYLVEENLLNKDGVIKKISEEEKVEIFEKREGHKKYKKIISTIKSIEKNYGKSQFKKIFINSNTEEDFFSSSRIIEKMGVSEFEYFIFDEQFNTNNRKQFSYYSEKLENGKYLLELEDYKYLFFIDYYDRNKKMEKFSASFDANTRKIIFYKNRDIFFERDILEIFHEERFEELLKNNYHNNYNEKICKNFSENNFKIAICLESFSGHTEKKEIFFDFVKGFVMLKEI